MPTAYAPHVSAVRRSVSTNLKALQRFTIYSLMLTSESLTSASIPRSLNKLNVFFAASI